MPRLLSFDQHGAIAQRQAEGIEFATDRVIGAPVNNAQVGNTRLELTAEGELSTEWASAVVDEGQQHC